MNIRAFIKLAIAATLAVLSAATWADTITITWTINGKNFTVTRYGSGENGAVTNLDAAQAYNDASKAMSKLSRTANLTPGEANQMTGFQGIGFKFPPPDEYEQAYTAFSNQESLLFTSNPNPENMLQAVDSGFGAAGVTLGAGILAAVAISANGGGTGATVTQ